MQDIYAGPGLAGVPRGTIRKLRVVALEFRAAGIGHNGSSGPAGGALASTPISIGNGAWDVKMVLGEAKVYEDGSALFTVPARKPVYFQALDERGCAVQTMRSWSTLQPGEYCGLRRLPRTQEHRPAGAGLRFQPGHEGRAAARWSRSMARRAGSASRMRYSPFSTAIASAATRTANPSRRWSRAEPASRSSANTGPPRTAGDGVKDQLAFSLLGEVTVDRTAKRKWSDAYLVLTQAT